jgi:hypothetical protein
MSSHAMTPRKKIKKIIPTHLKFETAWEDKVI